MRKKKSATVCHIDHLELRRLMSTIYVDAIAPGPTHDGPSWADAYTNLQQALGAATTGTTIEVAQGTYKPTTGNDRTATFQLKNSVTLQGGYAGYGQPNPDSRDVTENPTILSGDIGTPVDNADNNYHVVTGSGTDSTAVLDGFTIKYGYADHNHNDNDGDDGGGMLNVAGSPTITNCIFTENAASHDAGAIENDNSSPTLINCTITGNTAGEGGGMYNNNSSPTLTNCILTENTATYQGGGMLNRYYSSPILTNCTISGNTAGNTESNDYVYSSGGGMSNSDHSSPTLINCILSGNTAAGGGGGMLNDSYSSPTLTNCILSGNTAYLGGGMVNSYYSSPVLTNCVISGNTAQDGSGGGISAYYATLTNCIFWGDAASAGGNEIYVQNGGAVTITYSDIDQTGFTGTGNIDADPKFVSPVATNGPTDYGDLHLQSDSSALNAGSNLAMPATISTDLDGNPRIVGGNIDMGAYEYLTTPIIYVDQHATGSNNGTDWANAYTSLQNVLISETNPVTIEVAQGTYYPTAGADRTATFQLKSSVNILGGYAGDTTANPAARDVTDYPTILSGDIGAVGVSSDNSYHVVTGSGTDSSAVLDGFTITGGYATGSNHDADGGGITNISGSPIINDCTITGNAAEFDGGGIFNNYSSPDLTDCTISGNIAGHRGGGVLDDLYSSPTLTNCAITGNTAVVGGGMCNEAGEYGYDLSSPTLTDCTISGNTAFAGGGGMYNVAGTVTLMDCVISGNVADDGAGGGILEWTYYTSIVTLTDCTLSGNTSSGGGGAMDSGGYATLTNCTISGNVSGGNGGGLNGGGGYGMTLINCTISGNKSTGESYGGPADGYGYGGGIDGGSDSSVTLTNCILWGDAASADNNEIYGDVTITYSDIDQTDFNNGNNIDADPKFVRPVGTDGPNDYGDLHLQTGSPALNAGSVAAVPNGITTDIDGHPRIVNNSIDIGAYEGATAIVVSLPTKLAFASQFAGIEAAQTIPDFQVKIEDQSDNVVTRDDSQITLSLSSRPAGGQIQGTTTATAVNGIATFTGISLSVPGSYILSAQDTADDLSIASSAFNVTAAPAITVSENNQPITNNQSTPVSFGTAVQGAADLLITFTLSDTGTAPLTISLPSISGGGYTFTSPPSSTDIAVGASESFTIGMVPLAVGVHTANIIFTTNDPNDLNFSIPISGVVNEANPPPTISTPAAVTFTTEPVNTTSGNVFSVVVAVEDADGNVVNNDNSAVTLSIANGPADATLGGTLTATAINGVATFSNLTLNRAGAFTLMASDGQLTAATSTSFDISYASLQLVFAQQPANVTAGNKFSVLIDTDNTNGTVDINVKSKIKIKILSGPAGGKITGGTSGTSKNGAANFKKLAIAKTGTYILEAIGTAGFATGESTITIIPAAAAKIVFNPQPGNASASLPFNVSVELFDRYGNVATGDTSIVDLALGTHPRGSVMNVLSATADDGLADFDGITLDTAGNYSFKASDGKLKGTSKKFVVS